jgi:hypothetical protein
VNAFRHKKLKRLKDRKRCSFCRLGKLEHPERQSNKAALFSLTLCVCVWSSESTDVELLVVAVVSRHRYGLSETQRSTTLSLSVATQTSARTKHTFPGPLSASAHGPPLHATPGPSRQGDLSISFTFTSHQQGGRQIGRPHPTCGFIFDG